VGTVIQDKQRSNNDRHPRWNRPQRAALFAQYGDLQAQGFSQRQAAQALDVPRTTLQAWRAYQERLDEQPAVVAFFHSPPGLAFLHRLILGIHLVCTEIGACGIRLVCLLLKLTGLDRFVGASYGTQQQVNRQVEEAIVAYRREESARLAKDMPAKDITVAKDETFTGGLCLVAMDPKSNYITGVWRILSMAQIERKEISVYAMDAKPTRTSERISPCSSSLYTIRPHSWLLCVAYTSV
jgi:hypothetical protein